MKKWISFGDINKYLFYPFVGGMVKLLLELILDKIDAEFFSHPLIKGVNAGFGMSLSFIPFLITIIRTKKLNAISSNIAVYANEKLEGRKKIIQGKFALLFICAFLDFLQKYLSFNIIHDQNNNVWIFDLIFFVAFSMFILNEKLYRHQYLSLILIIIVLLISIFWYDYSNIKEKVYDFLLVLYIEFVYSINHVLNKYLMETKFCNPYEISFYEGIFSLIINIILLSIISNIEIPKYSGVLKVFKHKNYDGKIYIDNFKYYMDKFSAKEFFVFLLVAFNRVSYNLFSLLTIKHFTPSHVIIILLFGEMEYGFETVMRGDVAFTFFFFLILFFLILVFTEVIELNFFGISSNTKKNIRERAAKMEESNSRNYSFQGEKVEMDGVIIDMEDEDSEEKTL